jgi:anti-sigma regulatory factor (Ser/Thr protein kinase)
MAGVVDQVVGTALVRAVDHTVVGLAGRLAMSTVPAARAVVMKLLAEGRPVLVDLAELRLGWDPAAHVFSSTHAAAGGWPAAHVVLFNADRPMTVALQSHAPRTVPLVADLAAAQMQIGERPGRVQRRRDLPRRLSALAAARALTREVCADWGAGAVVDDAVFIVNELVTNAVEHARSESRVTLTLDGQRLHVAVRDFSPCEPLRARPTDIYGERGRGLLMTAAMSRSWGVTDHPDGKTVWAVLPMPLS